MIDVIKFINKLMAKVVTKILRFLLRFTWHITKLNSVKLYLNQYSFAEENYIGEYDPQEIMPEYSWIVRKFEDPNIMSLGVMHHGYISENSGKLIEIVEYGCETELKIDAAIKKTRFEYFLKESLDFEFYIYKIDKKHQNDINISESITQKRLGEKKYNFLTNTCEDLCIDVLIKPEHCKNYQNQIKYLLDVPNIKNYKYFYQEKTKQDEEILKKFIPCRYDKENNKILVFKNPLI